MIADLIRRSGKGEDKVTKIPERKTYMRGGLEGGARCQVHREGHREDEKNRKGPRGWKDDFYTCGKGAGREKSGIGATPDPIGKKKMAIFQGQQTTGQS